MPIRIFSPVANLMHHPLDGADGSFFYFSGQKTPNSSKCVQNSAHNTHNMKRILTRKVAVKLFGNLSRILNRKVVANLMNWKRYSLATYQGVIF
jgi:hypothetical protein